ncbi:MAG: chaperone NapD [Planctomycetota bacterium]
MPIGGFVITAAPEDRGVVEGKLSGIAAVSVEGGDDQGNIIAVLDTATSDEMDDLVKTISSMDEVLTVGLAYLNAEDEIGRIESGELRPDPFKKKKKRS